MVYLLQLALKQVLRWAWCKNSLPHGMLQVIPSTIPVDIRLPTIGRDAVNLEGSLPSQNGGDDFSSDEDFDSDSDDDDSLAKSRKEQVPMLPSQCAPSLLHGVMARP